MKKYESWLSFKKHTSFWLIAGLVAVSVLVLLMIGNNTVSNAFSRLFPDPYAGKMIYFYGDGCDQCVTVDNFVTNNKVEARVPLVRLEVFNHLYNSNLLIDKAKQCGLDIQQIGVPFIFDGQTNKCIVGSVDIVNFFRAELKKH